MATISITATEITIFQRPVFAAVTSGILSPLAAAGTPLADEAARGATEVAETGGVGCVTCELDSCATGVEPELAETDRPDSVSRFRRISSERISAAP